MSLQFAAPNHEGSLRQGEILVNVWEHRSLNPAIEHDEGAEQEVESHHHSLAVLVSPECDLVHDFAARYPDDYEFPHDGMEKKFREHPDQYYVDHVLFCDAYEESDIRSDMDSDIFRRVKQNQDKRYHHLGPAPIDGIEDVQLNIYLDFKSVFSMPSSVVYSAVRQNVDMRLAVVPSYYMHDLIHRFYGFQSRVALPE